MRIFAGRKPGELLVELVIVVVGILIAIGLDSAWQERADRQTEERILQALHEEFQGSQNQLNAQMRVYLNRNAATAKLLELGPAAADLPADSLDALWLWVTRSGSYDPPSGVLESILASGDLNLIRDRELQIALGEWPGAVENFKQLEDQTRILIHEQFLPWLRLRTPLPRKGFGGDAFPEGRSPADVSLLSNSFEVENFLRELLAWGQIITRLDYQRLQTTLDRILELTAPEA